MLPKLNLDGTLNKRPSSVQERLTEEGQPGLYSPRVASAMPPAKGPAGASTPPRTSSSTPATAATLSGGAAVHPGTLSPPHLSPHDMSLVEDGVVGISDPEMNRILAAKARHGVGERSPPTDRFNLGGMGPGGSSPPGKRRAAPLATLVDHQQARQSVPQSPSGSTPVTTTPGSSGTPAEASPSPAASRSSASLSAVVAKRRALAQSTTTTSSAAQLPEDTTPVSGAGARAAAPAAPAAAGAGRPPAPPPSTVSIVTAEEVYLSGRPFQAYMRAASITLSARASLTEAPSTPTSAGGSSAAPAATAAAAAAAATGAHLTTTFHQNPSQYVSALATQGDFVAVGDRTGRVVVMRQGDMAAGPRRTLLDVMQRSGEAEASAMGCGSGAAPPSSSSPGHISVLHRVRDPYEFYVAQQAYVPVIDTLNSVEVSPTVTALAFLPQSGPTTYLLVANEKVPKLYKIMSVRESANPFRAVDKIGTKTIGPLTASTRASTVAMKPVSRYAMNHEYNIHSLCPIAYSDQFATADDATVLLWCTEYPDTSIETYDLRSPYDEGPCETIRAVRNFPHEPFLFFVATSGGSVRVVDTRQTLRWADQAAQVFANPLREEDEPFSNVANSICDCALSPSGRYIAGRDFMSVCLWDIRMAGGARNGPLSPRRPAPSLRSSGDGVQECGMVRRWALHPHLRSDLDTIYQSNLLFEKFDVQFLSSRQVCTGGFNNILYTMDVESTGPETASDIRTFQLPKTEGIADFRRTTVSAHRPGEDRVGTGQGLGSRMTLMSRPCMSMSGTCGMVVACGQAVLQLSYTPTSK